MVICKDGLVKSETLYPPYLLFTYQVLLACYADDEPCC